VTILLQVYKSKIINNIVIVIQT